MSDITRLHWRLDVSDAVDLPGAHEIAADLLLPHADTLGERPLILSCLPGGFLTRSYYDLEVDGSRTYSFAEHMAARGFISVAFDHLGIGASSRPPDEQGFELGVEAFARADHAALDQVMERLRTGKESDLAALPGLRSIGVGHSMGSCLSVVQQAVAPSHTALVLFSFTTAGLPEALTPEELGIANDREQIQTRLVELARKRFGSPWPQGGGAASDSPGAAFQVGTAPEDAGRALQNASTNVLAIPGLLSMIPGGYAPYAECIDVPVFIAAGDHDIHSVRDVPAHFPKSPEVVAYLLEDTWHCHFVSNQRTRLWDRVAHWLRGAV
jgi:pimeloyl-ACP methyl ester carboxylesterase